MDGNFGLVRKKNAGTSTLGPKHGERLFVDDAKVIGKYVDGPKDVHVPKNTVIERFLFMYLLFLMYVYVCSTLVKFYLLFRSTL